MNTLGLTTATASELIQNWEEEKRIKAMEDEDKNAGIPSAEFTQTPWTMLAGPRGADWDFSIYGGRKQMWIADVEKSNAQLLFAAPVLYAALDGLLGFLNATPLRLNEGDSITLSMLTDAGRAALALAEEKQ